MRNYRSKIVKTKGIVGCLFFLLLSFQMGCDSYEVIIEDLSQTDANTALVLLRDKNIAAVKEGQASRKNSIYQIKVKRSEANKALRLLVYNRIPRIERAGLKEVYPPGSSGLMPTKSDEFARLMMAMQGEMEALLKVIPNIADAKVVFSYDSPIEYNKASAKKSASVTLIYRPNQEDSTQPLSDDDVKKLIAASISGLSIEDVTVVQKIIQPIDYVDVPDSVIHAPSEQEQGDSLKTFWYLMILTLVALIVAAYSASRLYFQKRLAQT